MPLDIKILRTQHVCHHRQRFIVIVVFIVAIVNIFVTVIIDVVIDVVIIAIIITNLTLLS